MLALFLILAALRWARQAGIHVVWGTGEKTCGADVGTKLEHDHAGNTRKHLGHINWIKQLRPGINRATDFHMACDPDHDMVRSREGQYCREHPPRSVAEASAGLSCDLEGQGR